MKITYIVKSGVIDPDGTGTESGAVEFETFEEALAYAHLIEKDISEVWSFLQPKGYLSTSIYKGSDNNSVYNYKCFYNPRTARRSRYCL